MKAHVTSTGSKYANDLYDGISMKAEEEFLHISRDSSDGKYMNNNFVLPLSNFTYIIQILSFLYTKIPCENHFFIDISK